MEVKLKTLFFLYRSKTNQKGEAPIYCRVTLNKKRKQFSTGYFIRSGEWDRKRQMVKSSNPLSDEINNHLISLKQRILRSSLQLEAQESEISVDSVISIVLGKNTKVKKLLEVFKHHNRREKSLLGKSYTKATLRKSQAIYGHVKDFIHDKLKLDDISLKALKLKFLLDFEYYLKADRNLKQATINKSIQKVKKVIKYAIGNDWLDKDPFLLHKAKSVHQEVIFLSVEELKSLEEYPFDTERLEKVRDCFIFCCYTGLPYTEMANLRASHIVKGFDGKDWIKIVRKKTGRPMMIPLLPKALQILEGYNTGEKNINDPLLPVISNQRFNVYLKEIAEIVGIKKKLSHHVARKTFASTVLLYNDVPMEIVSELLGHSSMAITQKHYGKVVKKKVSDHVNRLTKRLDKNK